MIANVLSGVGYVCVVLAGCAESRSQFCLRTCQFGRSGLICLSILLTYVSIWPIGPDQDLNFAYIRVNLVDRA